MKKSVALFLVVAMLFCAFGTAFADNAEGEKIGLSNSKDIADIRVALILFGAVSDMGWDYTAWCGLEKIKALGAQTSYIEKVELTNFEMVARQYADDGYDVIIINTNAVQDVGVAVAADYPETQFIMIGSDVVTNNLAAISIKDQDQGFMMGAIAALASKTGVVGFVGATTITPIVNGAKGFEQGAKYINPDITVLSTFTGSDTDVNLAKETAKAMIENNADVVASICSGGAIGVLQAAEEGGIYALSESSGQAATAPNSVLTAVNKDTSIAHEKIFLEYLEGTMSTDVEFMGANAGVVYLDPWNEATASALNDEARAKVQETYEKLASGEITINLD